MRYGRWVFARGLSKFRRQGKILQSMHAPQQIYMGTFLQVHLNEEDPNLQELLQAGRGGILMEDFVKYSLDMKLLDVQVFESMTWKKFQW